MYKNVWVSFWEQERILMWKKMHPLINQQLTHQGDAPVHAHADRAWNLVGAMREKKPRVTEEQDDALAHGCQKNKKLATSTCK